MIHYFYKIYGLLLGEILSRIFALFVSPKADRVLVGCSAGKHFNGNSKEVFDTMFSEGKDVFFITRDVKLYKVLSVEYNNRIIFSYSFRALWIFLTSQKLVLSHGDYDVTPFQNIIKNKKVTNLWHGFPIKRNGVLNWSLTDVEKQTLLDKYKKIDLMVSGSETESKIYHDSFGVDLEKIKSVGSPRYDVLLQAQDDLLENLGLPSDKKIILYAPTYRADGSLKIFPFDDYSFEKLNDKLVELDAILLMRFHINDKDKVASQVQYNDRIVELDQSKLQEVNEILPFVDVLITDYSSLFVDFVVVDKPMMFFPYDIEVLNTKSGFSVDMKEIYPGKIINTFEEFIINLVDFVENPNVDAIKRKEFRNKYFQFELGKSTQEVIKLIESL